MDRAINKSTDNIINALEVFKNGSYQNLDRGEWIMPQDSVDNYNECSENDLHVHYVKEKEFRNKWGTSVWVSPHFAKYPGSVAKTISESEEHKKIKNWLFTKIKKDDLNLVYSKGSKKYKFDNYVRLSELDINWNKYNIEISTKGYKTLRADILLQFHKKHEFLGNGIFIEIQLSNQSKKETYERSFSRAIHGYSTAWLFEEDFLFDDDNKDIQLKEDKIKLFSFSSEIKYSGKTFVKNLKIVVEKQCRYLDEKMKESTSNSDDIVEKMNETFQNIDNEILKSKDSAIGEIEDREDELIEKIKNLHDNPFEVVIQKYKDEINILYNESITKIDNHLEECMKPIMRNYSIAIDNIKRISELKIREIEDVQKRIISCPKCTKDMIFKITKFQKKELYECLSCKHTIWVK